jgi:LysR family transcriptional activator of nhaA
MEWLNYHHLLYFWVVAREGSVAKASQELGLAQPTISGQIHALERAIEQKLFARSGRNLVLTETGQLVYKYAEEIFSVGRELQDALRGNATGEPGRFQVGVVDVVPKLVLYKLLAPLMKGPQGIRLVVRDGKPDRLVADLSIHALDLVISDQVMGPTVKVKAYHHLLGECGVTVFGTPKLVAKYGKDFPASLNGAPFLLPTDAAPTRRDLDEWFSSNNIRPTVVAEFDDSGTLKTFGFRGEGLFVVPTVIEDWLHDEWNLKVLGRIDSVKERLYAVTLDRKVKHPVVQLLLEAARTSVFV